MSWKGSYDEMKLFACVHRVIPYVLCIAVLRCTQDGLDECFFLFCLDGILFVCSFYVCCLLSVVKALRYRFI